jgi:hypothetical protein
MTKLKIFKTVIIEPRVKINNKKLKTFSKIEKIRNKKRDLQQQTDHHSPPYKEEDSSNKPTIIRHLIRKRTQ